MNKWSKRFAAGVMAAMFTGVLSMQYVSYVSAAEASGNAQAEYVESVIGAHLTSSEYASMENISVSNALPQVSFETGEKYGDEYAVFYNDTVIGLLYVIKVNGEYYSSFIQNYLDGIQKVFDDGNEAVFSSVDEQIVIYDGDDLYEIHSDVPVDITVNEELSASLTDVEQEFTDLAPAMQSRGAGSYYCDVEPVPNVSLNGGICWAASIAAKYNYVNGYTQGDSGYVGALGVYNVVKNLTGNTPVGIPFYYQKGLQAFGLLDSYCASSISATRVFAELAWDNPILIDVTGTAGTHSLIICGISVPANYAIYTIVDSNLPEKVTIQCGLENGASFVYPNPKENNPYGDGYFTSWFRTFSYKFDS